MRIRLSLRSKLLAVFLSLLLIPTLGIGIYSYLFMMQTVLDKSIDVAQQNLASQAVQVQTILMDSGNNLIYLTNLQALRVLESSSQNAALYQSSLQLLRTDLQTYIQTHPIVQYLAYYDASGEATIALWSADTIQQTDVIQGLVNQVLRAPAETTHLSVIPRNDPQTADLILALRSDNGVMLTGIRGDMLFQPGIQSSTPVTWSLQLPIDTVLHAASDGSSLLSPRIEQYGDGDTQQQSNGYYVHQTNYTFFQRVSVPTARSRYDVVLFYTIPASHLQPDLNQFASAFITLMIGVLFCVIALALFAIARFITPLRHLRQSMDEIRKTERTPLLPQAFPADEIGDLSLSFYSMALELEAKRNSERALVDKLITAQEDERKRIAYDLHDGLLQQLIGARFQLSQCKALLSDDALDMHLSGYEALSDAIVEGRRIMQGLHPSTLDDLGIVEALCELIETAAVASNWQPELDIQQLSVEPDRLISVTLYRVAQEALNNINKHAFAHRVLIKLWQDDRIHLLIRDDGQGFDTQQRSRGWGLRTMRERVTLLHGLFKLESDAGAGTVIYVQLPGKSLSEKERQNDSIS